MYLCVYAWSAINMSIFYVRYNRSWLYIIFDVVIHASWFTWYIFYEMFYEMFYEISLRWTLAALRIPRRPTNAHFFAHLLDTQLMINVWLKYDTLLWSVNLWCARVDKLLVYAVCSMNRREFLERELSLPPANEESSWHQLIWENMNGMEDESLWMRESSCPLMRRQNPMQSWNFFYSHQRRTNCPSSASWIPQIQTVLIWPNNSLCIEHCPLECTAYQYHRD